MSKLLKVGVIRGGVSTEKEVSMNTGSEIIKNLNRDKYEVFDIVINSEREVFEKLENLDLDFVYIALHGIFGEDGRVQAILESLGIAYGGSGVMSSALCIDKELTKKIVETYGVRTAKGVAIRRGEGYNFQEIKEKLGDRIIVKPNSGGSSIGVSFVETEEEFKKALELVYTMDDNTALVEEVLSGTEISVPVIDGKVFPTVKIEAVAGDYFDYESKYAEGGAREFVFEFPEEIQNEIDKFAYDSYYAVKCEGFARVDFMVVGDKPYFMEVNTLPGMTAASLLPKSTASKGYSYAETLDLLIEASRNIKR